VGSGRAVQVQGIATIDRQPGSETIVVWVTKRLEPLRADNTNAVAIDAASDPKAMDKVHSLTRCCAVLVTEGSVLEGLPVEGEPLTVADIDALVAETEAHQQAILDAVSAYKRRTRSANLKDPTFPKSPAVADFTPSDDSPSQRALGTANYVGRAWSAWLKTDEERRRRTARPKTGETPWMMPDELNSPEVALLPAKLVARFREQPLV